VQRAEHCAVMRVTTMSCCIGFGRCRCFRQGSFMRFTSCLCASWVPCSRAVPCRKERRRKLGLPEELTPEEEEAERQKLAADAGREAARRLPVKPVTRIARLRETLVQMKKTSDPVRSHSHMTRA
jgi:hypothetical protein